MGAVQDALLYTIFRMLAFLWISIWQMGIWKNRIRHFGRLAFGRLEIGIQQTGILRTLVESYMLGKSVEQKRQNNCGIAL